MTKLLPILFLSIFLTGCSILPRVTFDRPNTVPQKVEKSQKTMRCKGEIKLDDIGRVVSCGKDFYSHENSFNQSERALTFKEKILNFFANLQGYFFWIALVLIIFFPGVIGWLIANVFNGARTALTSVVRGIQKAKANGVNLSPEERTAYFKYLDEILTLIHDENKDDPKTIKLIDQIRTDLKIKEGL